MTTYRQQFPEFQNLLSIKVWILKVQEITFHISFDFVFYKVVEAIVNTLKGLEIFHLMMPKGLNLI